MIWQLCVQFSNGSERVLQSYKSRDLALKQVDAIYASGYPMHMAFVVRHAMVEPAPIGA
ncbi:family 2 glycosyl transferase [Leptolyngbya sp. AN02str]